MGQDLALRTSDDVALAATWFPAADGAHGTPVLVNSATSVPRKYYARFAEHLVAHGFSVLTFDYRGIGGSRPKGSLRAVNGGPSTWAKYDVDTALRELLARTQRQNALVVGHSIGGQIFGLVPEPERFAAMVGVACQSGDWRLWRGRWKAQMFVLMHALIPGTAKLFGHVPKWLGIGEPLPHDAATEWARWCRTPGYLMGDDPSRRAQYARITGPLLGFSVDDDDYAPRQTVEAWLTFFDHAQKEHRHVRPSDVGAKAIGHFGFFRPQFEGTLWRQAREFLEQHRGLVR